MSAGWGGRDNPPPGGHVNLHDLGEFGLIHHIAALLGTGSAVVGIGDDAAVLEPPGDADYLLATVDMLVEGVHFRLTAGSPADVGRRAIAVNVSDIAAMGGVPACALVSLALPEDLAADDLSALYGGIAEEARRYRVEVVGGNLTATSGPLCIDVTLLGTVPRGEVVLRSGGRVGDMLAVTGSLGGQTALRLAQERGLTRDEGALPAVRRVPAVPAPRVEAGRALAAHRLVHAMLDLSDGLAGDLHHLCEACGVGAVLRADDIPISPAAREIAPIVGQDALTMALTGGEDYELLAAIPRDRIGEARDAVHPVPLTVVGELVTAAEGIGMLDREGKRRDLPPSGWTHF